MVKMQKGFFNLITRRVVTTSGVTLHYFRVHYANVVYTMIQTFVSAIEPSLGQNWSENGHVESGDHYRACLAADGERLPVLFHCWPS